MKRWDCRVELHASAVAWCTAPVYRRPRVIDCNAKKENYEIIGRLFLRNNNKGAVLVVF